MKVGLLKFGIVLTVVGGQVFSSELSALAEPVQKRHNVLRSSKVLSLDERAQSKGPKATYADINVTRGAEYQRTLNDWRIKINSELRKRFEVQLKLHPEIDIAKLKPIEVVYCVRSDRTINHVFYLGLKSPVKEVLADSINSLNGDKILEYKDPLFSKENEIDVRFSYPLQDPFVTRSRNSGQEQGLFYYARPRDYLRPAILREYEKEPR